MESSPAAGPFSAFERMVAWRYLRSRRREAFISVIAGFSFVGIMLGVATLIIVMAVMNGFRTELISRILGINGHMIVQPIDQPFNNYADLAKKFTAVPGVTMALPLVEGQMLASGREGAGSGALVRGVRAEDLEKVTAQYQALGLAVDLQPFFRDIPARLATAHLLVSRAGASTVAELTAAGRPAVMVPLPNSIDDHQAANAAALAEAGGGWIAPQKDFDAARLAGLLTDLITHPAKLAAAADVARRLGHRDAAQALADLVIGLLPGAVAPQHRETN